MVGGDKTETGQRGKTQSRAEQGQSLYMQEGKRGGRGAGEERGRERERGERVSGGIKLSAFLPLSVSAVCGRCHDASPGPPFQGS